MDKERMARIGLRFFKDELLDYEVYKRLAHLEKDRRLRALLEKIARMEEKHMRLWKSIIGSGYSLQTMPTGFSRIKIPLFLLARRLLGVAFVTKLLGRNEINALNKYSAAMHESDLSKTERQRLGIIIRDEEENEENLKERLREYRGQLEYTRSIVLGLNDGLVELLAAISGIAVIATSSIVVVIGGIIIGVAGTLSMAGGVYLSSKSHGLMEETDYEDEGKIAPGKDAFYTGIYYFIGALISVLPFIFGLNGFAGIAASIILVSIALTTVSVVIAVITSTSISKRIMEMLAISLGAVFVTIVLGTIARVYFGVVI